MLGYLDESKAYLLYDLIKINVVCQGEVIFDEKMLGVSLLEQLINDASICILVGNHEISTPIFDLRSCTSLTPTLV